MSTVAVSGVRGPCAPCQNTCTVSIVAHVTMYPKCTVKFKALNCNHPELLGCITTLAVRNGEAKFCAAMDTLRGQDELQHDL